MSKEQQIEALREALKIAMSGWSAWVDDSCGARPDDETEGWLQCRQALIASGGE